jgi:cytochrome c
MRTLVVAVIALAASTGTTLAQDASAGEQVFKRLCMPCHDIGAEAKVKLGPPLNGVDGRHSGSFEGFNYSPANKNSGITWDEATFREYIKDPKAKVPGTKMIFAGVKDEKRVNDLVAYLKQFDASGKKVQ